MVFRDSPGQNHMWSTDVSRLCTPNYTSFDIIADDIFLKRLESIVPLVLYMPGLKHASQITVVMYN